MYLCNLKVVKFTAAVQDLLERGTKMSKWPHGGEVTQDVGKLREGLWEFRKRKCVSECWKGRA